MKENKYKLNKYGRDIIIDLAEQEMSTAIERTERKKKTRKEGMNFTMHISESLLKEMFDSYK